MHNVKSTAALALAAAAGIAGAACAQPRSTLSLEQRVRIDSPYVIKADPEEAAYVSRVAQKAIEENCAQCHGPKLQGKTGVPNLMDYEWIWAITFEETNDVGPIMDIEQTIRYGIRNQDCSEAVQKQAHYGKCADTRYSEMPGFVALGALTEDQVDDLTEYVLDLGGRSTDAAAAARGKMLFSNCVECHGEDGRGNKFYGGPDLTDDVWLYGGDRTTIAESIRNGRAGMCPAFVYRLDETTIRAIAIYIWQTIQYG